MYPLQLIGVLIVVIATEHLVSMEADATDRVRLRHGLLDSLLRKSVENLSSPRSSLTDDLLMKIKKKCMNTDCKTQTEEAKASRRNVVDMLTRNRVKQQHSNNTRVVPSEVEDRMVALQRAKMAIAKAEGLDRVLVPTDDGLWEDDMILSREQSEAIIENAAIMVLKNRQVAGTNDDNRYKRRRRSVYHFESFPSKKWALPIAYRIKDTAPHFVFTKDERQSIKDAIKDIESKTCVRFMEISSSVSLTFSKSSLPLSQCGISSIGKGSSEVFDILLGTCNKNYTGAVIHHIMHALGFRHTHNRPDRDQFIEIKAENIDPQAMNKILKTEEITEDEFTNYGVPYDYYSIMHFASTDLSKNGEPAMVAKTKPVAYFTSVMGRRDAGLSSRDAKMVQKAYCRPGCTDKYAWCGSRKLKGHCKEESGLFGVMRLYCLKSCNLCS